MAAEKCVLRRGLRLNVTPLAVEDVLPAPDELAGARDGAWVDHVLGHVPDSCWSTRFPAPGQAAPALARSRPNVDRPAIASWSWDRRVAPPARNARGAPSGPDEESAVPDGAGRALAASELAEQGVLRPDLTREQAANVVWILASFDSYDLLTTGRGLSPEATAATLVRTAEHVLLG